MNSQGPSAGPAVLICAALQGIAIYKARQQNTWPAPRTELGIVVVGLLFIVGSRFSPAIKWLGLVVVLGAMAGVGTNPGTPEQKASASPAITEGKTGQPEAV